MFGCMAVSQEQKDSLVFGSVLIAKCAREAHGELSSSSLSSQLTTAECPKLGTRAARYEEKVRCAITLFNIAMTI